MSFSPSSSSPGKPQNVLPAMPSTTLRLMAGSVSPLSTRRTSCKYCIGYHDVLSDADNLTGRCRMVCSCRPAVRSQRTSLASPTTRISSTGFASRYVARLLLNYRIEFSFLFRLRKTPLPILTVSWSCPTSTETSCPTCVLD